MLSPQLARKIVEQTMIRLNRNINIMNEKGIIIASGDSDRINQIHEGALEVVHTGKPLIIYDTEIQNWQGTLPGINLPIRFMDRNIAVIGITGHPDEIMEFGELVKMITEMMIEQSFLTEQIEWKQRLKAQVFDELVKTGYDRESVRQKLNLLEITLIPPYQVALVDLETGNKTEAELLKIFDDIFIHQDSVIIGFLHVNRIFILASRLKEDTFSHHVRLCLAKLKEKDIFARIGLGLSVPEENHIFQSYEAANLALLAGDPEQQLITFPEVETKALITGLDERTKQQFQRRVLGNLSDKFIDTLDQLFKNNQHIGACAKSLFIHRNSLLYRLKRIKEETGYDPLTLNDAITLQLAVWIRQLQK
ncbi:CdaR family transcriptional regulator [Peribacillus sp. SCS-155]|uniref:CdaR family transcriptional regulator n=1 Tax=Peribacillus sedimenti TaxID=3115297 RepID=UPI00390668F7